LSHAIAIASISLKGARYRHIIRQIRQDESYPAIRIEYQSRLIGLNYSAAIGMSFMSNCFHAFPP
jgi:hypothetical protein